MATKQLVTVKVTIDSRRMLRVLAAHSGAQLCEELEDILWQKMKAKKLALSQGKNAKARNKQEG